MALLINSPPANCVQRHWRRIGGDKQRQTRYLRLLTAAPGLFVTYAKDPLCLLPTRIGQVRFC